MPSPLTRAEAETVLVRRCKAAMVKGGLDVTANHPNADLEDPIASALEQLGFPPGDRMAVVDADMVGLDGRTQSRFLDLAEIRVLESSLLFLAVKPTSQQWFQQYKVDYALVASQMSDLIKTKWELYKATWTRAGGVAVATMDQAVANQIDNSGYWKV